MNKPLTIDGMSDILLPISKTITILVEQLESLVPANCQSTNISEESAELLAEAGHAALRHSRALMRELTERRRDGRGASALLPPDAAPSPEASLQNGERQHMTAHHTSSPPPGDKDDASEDGESR